MDRFGTLLMSLGPVGVGDVVMFRGLSLSDEAQADLQAKVSGIVGHSDFLLVLLDKEQGLDILDRAAMRSQGWVHVDDLKALADAQEPG